MNPPSPDKSPMRIAVVNPYGTGTTYSGPAVFLSRLMEPVSREHHTVVLYGIRDLHATSLSWATVSVPIMTFRRYSVLEQMRWSFRATRWLLRHLGQYDMVHFHGAALFNLLPALAAIVRRRRYLLVALSARGDLSPSARSNRIPLVAALRRRLVSGATVGLALSDDIASEFAALGLPSQRIVPMQNPVDTTRFAPLVPPGEDPRALSHTLGFVGKLCARKRPDLVLESLALLRQRGFHEARAVFVGPFDSPEYERFFRDRMTRLAVTDAVELLGYCADVSTVLAADVSLLVLPSTKEGLPGALVEAMACGLPAIVTDVGAMGRTVRDAGCGWVVEADPEAIAAAVTELWVDRDRWIEYSTAAQRYARSHCDIKAVVHTYVSALSEAGKR
ncbi:glycosyltransferase family 4 protein [Micromonospora sp. NPDC049374]|uniref:glycosyltransferase family 4 protein n=1 Tax=Micromonospora sp. NPDC049374 TaxID=3154352 RepID=UPI0034318641